MTRERLIVALGLGLSVTASAGCGDNLLPDPFLGLVRVSGPSPFADRQGLVASGVVFVPFFVGATGAGDDKADVFVRAVN